MLKKIFLITILLFTFFTQLTFAAEQTFQELISVLEDAQQQSDENKDTDFNGIYENKIERAEFELDQARDEFPIEAARYDYENKEEKVNSQAQEMKDEWQGHIDWLYSKVEELKKQEEIIQQQADNALDYADSLPEGKAQDEAYAKAEILDEELEKKLEEIQQQVNDTQKKADDAQQILDDDIEKKLSESDDEKKVLSQALMEWDFKEKKEWYALNAEIAQEEYEEAIKNNPECNLSPCKELKIDAESAQEEYQKAKDDYDDSTESKDDISSRGYMINVNDISPWKKVESWDTVKMSINRTLGTVIQSLMMLLWSLALLIMTVGAGFIILHHGQDELLSKWKTIFMSWVYALVVALGSYYLVAILRFLLFTGN